MSVKNPRKMGVFLTRKRLFRIKSIGLGGLNALHEGFVVFHQFAVDELAAFIVLNNFLDTLNGLRRLDEIRVFRSLDYGGKKARVLALTDTPVAGLLC